MDTEDKTSLEVSYIVLDLLCKFAAEIGEGKSTAETVASMRTWQRILLRKIDKKEIKK